MKEKTALIIFTFTVLMSASTLCRAQTAMKIACDIWPPYQMEQGGVLTGYSVELVHAVYDRMNLSKNYTITAYPWSRSLDMIERGTADALFSANYTPKREIFAVYPNEPLIETPWVLWTTTRHQIKTMRDLYKLRVGVVQTYSYTPKFWNFIKTYCTVDEVGTDEINFKKLAAGRIDVTVAELANGLFLRKRLDAKSIVPLENLSIKTTGLYIIFNKNNVPAEFVKSFSQELKQFKQTPRYQELKTRYFYQDELIQQLLPNNINKTH